MFDFKRFITVALLLFLCMNIYTQEFGKNKVQQRRIHWSVIETRHFDIHFPRGEDEFGKLVALIAENAFYNLNEFFRLPLNNRIPIIAYSNKHEFQATNIIPPLLTEGIGGFTELLRNRVALPFDGSFKKFEEVLIHELVHAYINDMDNVGFRTPFMGGFRRFLPFWFEEGLSEFLALKGEIVYNNMFIIDMVVNNWLPNIEFLGGYFAYRLGEVFHSWVVETWDENKLIEYFYNLKLHADLSLATRRTFGMEFEDLQANFRLFLSRKYSNLVNEFQMPWEIATRHTNIRETNAFQNVFPRLSLCGNEFVFFTSNRGRTVIRTGSLLGLFCDRIVLIGERTNRFEEFHFQRNNIARFPESNMISFVSKTSFGDIIYFFDINRGRVIRSISFDDFDSIYEIDICPKGRLLAISAQKNHQCDIFIYDIYTSELTQITDDKYWTFSPNWSPCGTRLAFVSERDINPYRQTRNIFGQLVQNIFYYNIISTNIYRVTDDLFNNFFPVWASNDKLMFISESDKVANIELIDINMKQRKRITNILSGVHSFDYSPASETLVFSVYFNNVWEIYHKHLPLYQLEFIEETQVAYHEKTPERRPVKFIDDFHDIFQTHEYRLHGREPEIRLTREERREREQQIRAIARDECLRVNFIHYLQNTFNLVERPDPLSYNPPVIRNYRPRFHIDHFWGGMAFSSTAGAMGMLHLGFSDMLGDHAIGANVEFTDNIRDANFVFSYLFLPHRIDYGLAVFNFSDQITYRAFDMYGNRAYLRENRRQTGGYFITRYPLSRFFRLDLEHSVHYNRRHWDLWVPSVADWIEIPDSRASHLLYIPRFGFVFDNALYGSTGPMAGNKLISWIRHSFGESRHTFTTFYSDFRHYTLFPSNRFAFANRLVFGMSEGNNPERFHLTGFNGVRGFMNRNVQGNRIAMKSFEFRYPMIDHLRLGFPVPIQISNLRGSIWTDIGTVWWNDDFRGIRDGQLEDLKMSFGFGPRMNLGWFILQLDFAYLTDLQRTSRPIIYFTVNQEF